MMVKIKDQILCKIKNMFITIHVIGNNINIMYYIYTHGN